MKIHIREIEIFKTDLQARMPFKYGIATMTRLPHLFMRVAIDVDGQRNHGVSADHLPPKWFTKDPEKDPAEEIEEMLAVIRHAMDSAAGLSASTVFDLWQELYRAQDDWAAKEGIPPLLAHFGSSLVERAVLDAYTRSTGRSFSELLRQDKLGVDLGRLHAGLAGSRPADFLPSVPQARLYARHTVGLSDPLTENEIADDERLHDGLPQSLEACIRFYGLRHFKIKVSGQDLDRDVGRLLQLESVIAREAPEDYAISLDGNEGFQSVPAFQEFWKEFQRRPELRRFEERLLFVEQPFHRDLALEPVIGEMSRSWPDRPPIIIDESDGELGSLDRALELGYAGTSHKNCKGVFKGVGNTCRLEKLRRQDPGRRYVMSGEDLCNIGPVALLQDLAVQASLGIASVERNGHHYFAGLSFFPESLREPLLTHHSDLYTRASAGWPRVDIREGMISVASVSKAPFGLDFMPLLESFDRVYSVEG